MYRLQHLFPGDTRFQGESFWKLPIFAIADSLRAGQKLRREDLHAQELGLAALTAYTINANRAPKSKTPPARAKDFYHFEPLESKLQISKEAANAFFSITKDRLLPPWALAVIQGELSELEKLKDSNVKPGEYRAFEGENCLILAPSLVDNFIYASFVIWQCPQEPVEIWNVDDRPPGASRRYRPNQRVKIKPNVDSNFEGYCLDSVLTIITD